MLLEADDVGGMREQVPIEKKVQAGIASRKYQQGGDAKRPSSILSVWESACRTSSWIQM